MAPEHLLELGHNKIAFEGFVQCLKDNNVKQFEKNVLISHKEEESHDQVYEFKNGKQLTRKMLETTNELPAAIFCINDMTAFGVIQELSNNNIYVPHDISVMGFDNIPMAEITTPPLTTVDQPAYEMGALSAEMLIRNLENPNTAAKEIGC